MLKSRELHKLWSQLQQSKQPQFLDEIRIDGIRGIHGLKVTFDYPVCVLAGINASGKSTVLFAAACAYKAPGAGSKSYAPSTLFPDYRPKMGERSDVRPECSIEYEYRTPEGRRSMKWSREKDQNQSRKKDQNRNRKKRWNRSYFGRKDANQPERGVYLRTLSNLSNPSEVRSVLQMSQLKQAPSEDKLTAVQIDLAQRMLPFNYKEVVHLSSGNKNLLFATQKDGASYSEFHMAAGERVSLHLAQEIAQVREALILIDEVDTGLHPWAQEILMIQLQRLALRNNLQIIVTSHSDIVLNSVPSNARIFLDRDDSNRIVVSDSYRDVIQDVLYRRSGDVLHLLCEDDSAEAILQGIMDELFPRTKFRRGQLRIGRNTGAQEFPSHAKAFRRFGMLSNFVFILDGDQRNTGVEEKIRNAAKIRSEAEEWDGPIFFLPSDDAPEIWIWNCLERNREAWAAPLGADTTALRDSMEKQNATYDSASDTKGQIAKYKLKNFSESLHKTTADVCRIVAREEARRDDSEIQPLINDLRDFLREWRSRTD